MPYITPEARQRLEHGEPPVTPGELNYAITRLIDSYLVVQGVNYTNLNAVVGALECAKQELYRRVAAPLEDRKRAENGEVYAVVDHAEAPTERGSAVTEPGL